MPYRKKFPVQLTDSVRACSIFHVHRFRKKVSATLANSFFVNPNTWKTLDDESITALSKNAFSKQDKTTFDICTRPFLCSSVNNNRANQLCAHFTRSEVFSDDFMSITRKDIVSVSIVSSTVTRRFVSIIYRWCAQRMSFVIDDRFLHASHHC